MLGFAKTVKNIPVCRYPLCCDSTDLPGNYGGFQVERFPVERHSFVLEKNIITKNMITCSNMSIQYCIVLIHDEIHLCTGITLFRMK